MSINTPNNQSHHLVLDSRGPLGVKPGKPSPPLPPVSLNCPLVASFVKAEGIKEAEQMKEFLQRGSGSPGTAPHLIRDNNPPRLQKKKKKKKTLQIYKLKKNFSQSVSG